MDRVVGGEEQALMINQEMMNEIFSFFCRPKESNVKNEHNTHTHTHIVYE